MTEASLLLCAVILIGIGLAHSILGERWLIGPLLDPARRQGLLEKSRFAREVIRFAWHLTTLAFWSVAAVVVCVAMAPEDTLASAVLWAVSTFCFLSALAILISSRGRHLAWPFFATAGALCVVPMF